MVRRFLVSFAEHARDAALAVLAAAALADAMVWVYDAGRADTLRDNLADLEPVRQEDTP